ncbi:MAG: hypothetical protein II194_05175 [Bacteroidales bacterium]|nr:hypothetical protein [Bacteroidales bacterium]
MHHATDASACYSSLKLSDLVDYLDATDRVPVSTVVVVHIGVAAVEVEVVGVVASIVGIAVVVVAVAGSREKQPLKFLLSGE